MLAVRHIHIGYDIDDAAVGLLGQAFVLAAVPGFHMEDRNVKALCRNSRKTGVGIAENKERIGGYTAHELVRAVDDIANGRTEIVAYRVHIDLGVGKFQIPEEHPVEVIVIVLPCVGQHGVKVFAAFGYYRRKPYYLGARADNNEKLKSAVVFESDIGIVSFNVHFSTASPKVSG